jgi:hypothetical protein
VITEVGIGGSAKYRSMVSRGLEFSAGAIDFTHLDFF